MCKVPDLKLRLWLGILQMNITDVCVAMYKQRSLLLNKDIMQQTDNIRISMFNALCTEFFNNLNSNRCTKHSYIKYHYMRKRTLRGG